jgi:succinate dehydrogenase/fumarate reductase flavoprotein subunit
VVVATRDGEVEMRATRGVVLACGGFPHDEARRRQLLPHAPSGREHWSAAPPGNTGDGLRLGEAAGGTVADDLADAAALAPVSRVPRADGTTAHFPHLIERGKPGLIAVTAGGRRFTNEADPYHDFMRGLFAALAPGQAAEAWLVCDHAFIRRYGLGAVKPAPLPLARWRRNGYLQCAPTLDLLARACGIAPAALAATVRRYNEQAAAGRDADFGKGETPYNRMQGDAAAGRANPCMAPLERAPFYAVKIVPGSLGTFAGLRTDLDARVLDREGRAIGGLYAAGNDMASLMGGHYPSGGITLGPALTYGYIAAHHAAGVALPTA